MHFRICPIIRVLRIQSFGGNGLSSAPGEHVAVEPVLDMSHLADFAIFEDDLHDVEPIRHSRIIQKAEIIIRGADQREPFAVIDRARGPRP